LIFPYQANGSLHYVNGKLVGSDLIGQEWTEAWYFHGRPSATFNPSTSAPEPYAADNTTASNLGPTSKQLIDGNGSQVTIGNGTPVPAGAIPVAGKPHTYYVGTYLGVKNYVEQFRADNCLASNIRVPADMVTASGSGLDPDISVEGALLQVDRVARARGITNPGIVLHLVMNHVQGRFLGIFGEPFVNVLDINLALDGMKKYDGHGSGCPEK
jgi:K+-transporting ATPase ATPase C chain